MRSKLWNLRYESMSRVTYSVFDSETISATQLRLTHYLTISLTFYFPAQAILAIC